MKTLLNACRAVDRALFWLNVVLVGTILAVMTAIVIYSVVARYIFDAPPFWGEEAARFLMFFLVLTGSALALRLSQHPRLSMFVELFPARGLKAFTLVGEAVVVATLIILLIQGIELAIDEGIMRTPALRVSYFWIYLAYPLGAGLGLMQLVGRYFAPELAERINDGTGDAI